MTTTLSPIVDVRIDDQLVLTAIGRMAMDGDRVVREIDKTCSVIREIIAGTNEISLSSIANTSAKDLADKVRQDYTDILTKLAELKADAQGVCSGLTEVARAPRNTPKRR